MIDRTLIGAAPQPIRNNDYENTKKSDGPREDLPDFDKLMTESNSIMQTERQKEMAATGGNEMRIGETKSDADFREKLEKITGKKQDKAKNKLEKDDYLNLMVTQMKMQDPTKPMDNQEMASQLAQFNSVEQLGGISKQLAQLNSTQTAARGEKLTQYLGMNVQVTGSNLKLNNDGTTNEAFVELPLKASTALVEIKDSNGALVRTLKLGTLDEGQHKVEWDGKNEKGEKSPSGTYTFSVSASTQEGKAITARTSMSARVDGITGLADGGKLDTSAGIIDPKNILSVRAAPVAANAMGVPGGGAPTVATANPGAPKAAAQESAAPMAAQAGKPRAAAQGENGSATEVAAKKKPIQKSSQKPGAKAAPQAPVTNASTPDQRATRSRKGESVSLS